jgi:hypothetical protein
MRAAGRGTPEVAAVGAAAAASTFRALPSIPSATACLSGCFGWSGAFTHQH